MTHFSWPQYPGKIQNYTRTNRSNSERSGNYGENIFINFSCLFMWKMEKKNICPNKTFLENYFFQVQQLKGTMKFQVGAIHWG